MRPVLCVLPLFVFACGVDQPPSASIYFGDASFLFDPTHVVFNESHALAISNASVACEPASDYVGIFIAMNPTGHPGSNACFARVVSGEMVETFKTHGSITVNEQSEERMIGTFNFELTGPDVAGEFIAEPSICRIQWPQCL
jgi:hypothetical protein